MNITFPHTIENCMGEKLVFTEIIREPDGDRVVGYNYVAPGNGPIMHTHWLQDEGLTVLKGKIGYQIKGGDPQYAGEGASIVFKRGVPHRFWNAGDEVLHCKAWIKPANTFVFFISSVFAAQNKSGKPEPELFDGAYLMTRYASEYQLDEIPWGVRKIVMPLVYRTGKLLGKYKHFEDAPEPVRE